MLKSAHLARFCVCGDASICPNKCGRGPGGVNRMRMGTQSYVRWTEPCVQPFATLALVLVFLILSSSQNANALPAFARKYGLRCSACHESWPMLNYFGQKFKDNGYQLMNDRDCPDLAEPSYWPITFRMTPFWIATASGKVAVDSASVGYTRLTTSGFQLWRPRLSILAALWRRTSRSCSSLFRRNRRLPF